MNYQQVRNQQTLTTHEDVTDYVAEVARILRRNAEYQGPSSLDPQVRKDAQARALALAETLETAAEALGNKTTRTLVLCNHPRLRTEGPEIALTTTFTAQA